LLRCRHWAAVFEPFIVIEDRKSAAGQIERFDFSNCSIGLDTEAI
jgi:hypothetical protein